MTPTRQRQGGVALREDARLGVHDDQDFCQSQNGIGSQRLEKEYVGIIPGLRPPGRGALSECVLFWEGITAVAGILLLEGN